LEHNDAGMESAEEATADLAELKNGLLMALLSTPPTTVAGVVALAEYYRDVTLLSEGSEIPDSVEDAHEEGVEKSYLFFAAGNIARSSKAITVS
jgi:hypothetical protein